MAYSKEYLLTRLRMASKDGVAPSSEKIKPPYQTYVNHFGSWTKACELAEVRPQKLDHYCYLVRKKPHYGPRKGNTKTEQLAKVLHLAHEVSEDGVVDVAMCMEYVRRTDVV